MQIKVNNLPSQGFYAQYLKWPFGQTFWFTRNYIPQVAESELPTAAYNETHFNNPHFNSLFSQALRETDDAKRKELLGQCMEIHYNQGGYIIWGFERDRRLPRQSHRVRTGQIWHAAQPVQLPRSVVRLAMGATAWAS